MVMTHERRYREEEVAEIFEAAAQPHDPRGRALASGDGLTLEELQSIGREVGVDPDRIARAASDLELRRGAPPRGTHFGLPVSVGRVVELPRAPTDREWETLVGELRRTFGAIGKEESRGDLRAWRNGNLHASLEPTVGGWRLRLGTLMGDAAIFNRLAVGGMVAALLVTFVLLLRGDLAEDLIAALVFALMGVAALGYNVLRLPRWAQEREEQMEYIAGRARALLAPRELAPGGGADAQAETGADAPSGSSPR